MRWDNEPWRGSRQDYVRSVAGFVLLAVVFCAWLFVLCAIGGAK